MSQDAECLQDGMEKQKMLRTYGGKKCHMSGASLQYFRVVL